MLLRSDIYAFTILWFSIRYTVPFLLLSKNGKTGQFHPMDNAGTRGVWSRYACGITRKGDTLRITEITGCHRQCLGYTASDSYRLRP